MQARRDGVDGIVSFGGGSAADTGKAVCFFTEQEQGRPGASFADRPVLPHVVDHHHLLGRRAHAVLRHDRSRRPARRAAPAGRPSRPMAAFYDPSLTLSTPARVSAETGMNALAHCVEAAWSPQPHARGRGHRAGRRGPHRRRPAPRGRRPRRPRRPHRHARRASILAGRCLQNASMGVHHGLAQLVGGRTGIPHGLSNAIVLPAAMAFNAEAVPDALGRLARALGVDDADRRPCAALVERLGLPTRLSDVGVDRRGPRRRGPPVAGQRQRAGQPPPGQRGRRPRHPRVGVLSLGPSGRQSPRRRVSGASFSTRQSSLPSGSATTRMCTPSCSWSLEHRAAEGLDPGRRLVEVGHLEVDVHPVLALLGLGHLLEGERRPAVDRRREHHVLVPAGRHLDAERLAPEHGQPIGVGAVDDQVGETSDGGHARRR